MTAWVTFFRFFTMGLPVPRPMNARPSDNSLMVAVILAMTEGWMVTGSTTPCPILIRLVAWAARVIIMWTSRDLIGESTSVR